MKIKSIYAAIVLGTAAALGFAGCAGTPTQQSTGERIDDTATTVRVKHALSEDSEYKYPKVEVTTFKGRVQLSGFVALRPQKERAETLAKGTDGVREVVNNITISSQ